MSDNNCHNSFPVLPKARLSVSNKNMQVQAKANAIKNVTTATVTTNKKETDRQFLILTPANHIRSP